MTKLTYSPFGVAMLFAVTIIAESGCSSLTSKISLPTWGSTSSPKEIVAFWDTVIRTEDDHIYRGFAARVMFFDNSKKALRVRGSFDVYLFDEEATGKAAVTPVKIVRYQMNDLKALESDSKMFGKSYTLWVPWDELNSESEERKLSLFVRFKSDDGDIIVSKQATMSLPASPEKMAEKAEAEYENPYIESRLRQLSELSASAEKRKANPNSLDAEWKGTVAEYVVSREDRPEKMLTRTFNVPGYSRDGVVPTIKPEYQFASATDEQKYLAQLMISNAQVAHNRQANSAANQPAGQNQNNPINQVGFQTSGDNGAAWNQQPMFQPNFMQTQQPTQSLAPMTEDAMYRDYFDRQQAPSPQQTLQPPMSQPSMGNYAAANTGTVLR